MNEYEVKYRDGSHPNIRFRAVRLDEGNAQQVAGWCDGWLRSIANLAGDTVQTTVRIGEQIAEPGDWIVRKLGDDHFEVHALDAFMERYAPVRIEDV